MIGGRPCRRYTWGVGGFWDLYPTYTHVFYILLLVLTYTICVFCIVCVWTNYIFHLAGILTYSYTFSDVCYFTGIGQGLHAVYRACFFPSLLITFWWFLNVFKWSCLFLILFCTTNYFYVYHVASHISCGTGGWLLSSVLQILMCHVAWGYWVPAPKFCSFSDW